MRFFVISDNFLWTIVQDSLTKYRRYKIFGCIGISANTTPTQIRIGNIQLTQHMMNLIDIFWIESMTIRRIGNQCTTHITILIRLTLILFPYNTVSQTQYLHISTSFEQYFRIGIYTNDSVLFRNLMIMDLFSHTWQKIFVISFPMLKSKWSEQSWCHRFCDHRCFDTYCPTSTTQIP